MKLGLLSKEDNNVLKNRISRQISLVRKNYFCSVFEDSRRDLRKTWSLVKNLMSFSISKNNIRSIISNNIEYFDEESIAKTFNDYFSNIASELDSSLPLSETDPISFMRQPNSSSIFLKILYRLMNV